MENLIGVKSTNIVHSKGIHIVVPRVQNERAIAFQGSQKQHFFMVPWGEYSILGTTDVPYYDSLENISINREEVLELLNEFNQFFNLNLNLSDVKYSYAGVRSLYSNNNFQSTYNASRKYKIIDHQSKDNIYGLISAIGGKYTTSRLMAKKNY